MSSKLSKACLIPFAPILLFLYVCWLVWYIAIFFPMDRIEYGKWIWNPHLKGMIQDHNGWRINECE